MLDNLDFSYRVIRRGCVSLYPLYGGRKCQRRNYVLVPPGTVGLVSHEVVNEYRVAYVMVKFKVGKRLIHVRCAPTMVQLDPVSRGLEGT